MRQERHRIRAHAAGQHLNDEFDALARLEDVPPPSDDTDANDDSKYRVGKPGHRRPPDRDMPLTDAARRGGRGPPSWALATTRDGARPELLLFEGDSFVEDAVLSSAPAGATHALPGLPERPTTAHQVAEFERTHALHIAAINMQHGGGGAGGGRTKRGKAKGSGDRRRRAGHFARPSTSLLAPPYDGDGDGDTDGLGPETTDAPPRSRSRRTRPRRTGVVSHSAAPQVDVNTETEMAMMQPAYLSFVRKQSASVGPTSARTLPGDAAVLALLPSPSRDRMRHHSTGTPPRPWNPRAKRHLNAQQLFDNAAERVAASGVTPQLPPPRSRSSPPRASSPVPNKPRSPDRKPQGDPHHHHTATNTVRLTDLPRAAAHAGAAPSDAAGAAAPPAPNRRSGRSVAAAGRATDAAIQSALWSARGGDGVGADVGVGVGVPVGVETDEDEDDTWDAGVATSDALDLLVDPAASAQLKRREARRAAAIAQADLRAAEEMAAQAAQERREKRRKALLQVKGGAVVSSMTMQASVDASDAAMSGTDDGARGDVSDAPSALVERPSAAEQSAAHAADMKRQGFPRCEVLSGRQGLQASRDMERLISELMHWNRVDPVHWRVLVYRVRVCLMVAGVTVFDSALALVISRQKCPMCVGECVCVACLVYPPQRLTAMLERAERGVHSECIPNNCKYIARLRSLKQSCRSDTLPPLSSKQVVEFMTLCAREWKHAHTVANQASGGHKPVNHGACEHLHSLFLLFGVWSHLPAVTQCGMFRTCANPNLLQQHWSMNFRFWTKLPGPTHLNTGHIARRTTSCCSRA